MKKQVDVKALYENPQLQSAISKWDLFEFLNEFNIDYSMDGKNVGRGYIGVSPCPSCSDTKFHAGIHKDKHFLTCFKCKTYAGILKIISYYGKMSILDAYNYLIQYADETDLHKDNVQKVKEILFPKKELLRYVPDKKDDLPECKTITLKDLQYNRALKQFFIKRNLSILDIKRYDIRYKSNEIIFPVYLNNKIVSYQKRNILKKQYYIPENLFNYIYNQNNIIINKPLILVEGFFDCIKVDKFIRQNYSGKISVTTGFVKSISENQIRRIIDCRPLKVIVIYDNDSWFDYYRIKRLIPFDVDFIILPNGYDPDTLSYKQLTDIFKKEIKL